MGAISHLAMEFAARDELRAAYQRIKHVESVLATARRQIATLGGDYTTTEDAIQLAVLEEIDEVLG